ncbi:MAG: GIY-YIG nuclease family protein [Gillisia sp.]
MKLSYVYILNCADNSYYTGVTANLQKRMFEHATAKHPRSFTARRRPFQLVFYTEFTDIFFAISKEKQIKKWSRVKKEALIAGKFEDLPNLSKKDFRK